MKGENDLSVAADVAGRDRILTAMTDKTLDEQIPCHQIHPGQVLTAAQIKSFENKTPWDVLKNDNYAITFPTSIPLTTAK